MFNAVITGGGTCLEQGIWYTHSQRHVPQFRLTPQTVIPLIPAENVLIIDTRVERLGTARGTPGRRLLPRYSCVPATRPWGAVKG